MNTSRSAILVSLLAAVGAALLCARIGSASAPPGRFTVQAGTVADARSGLVWEQAFDPNLETLAGAQAYCQGLALPPGGWRLPSMKELQTLVDDSVAPNSLQPAIDLVPFPATPFQPFWTSTLLAGDASAAWEVDFFDGESAPSFVGSAKWVRCVH